MLLPGPALLVAQMGGRKQIAPPSKAWFKYSKFARCLHAEYASRAHALVEGDTDISDSGLRVSACSIYLRQIFIADGQAR